VESKSANRRLMGDILLDRLRQSTRNKVKPKDKKCRVPFRLGIAGPPGAGKSVSDWDKIKAQKITVTITASHF